MLSACGKRLSSARLSGRVKPALGSVGRTRLFPNHPSDSTVKHKGPQRGGSTAALPSFIAEVSFNAITYTITPVYVLMIAAPSATITRWLVQSWILAGILGLLYVFSLYQAWHTGAILPLLNIVDPVKLTPNWPVLSSLFNNPMVGVLAWAHLILMDFMQARTIWDEGQRQLIPTWHSLILCFMFGPLGLASHLVTSQLVWRLRAAGFRQQAVA